MQKIAVMGMESYKLDYIRVALNSQGKFNAISKRAIAVIIADAEKNQKIDLDRINRKLFFGVNAKVARKVLKVAAEFDRKFVTVRMAA